MRWSASLVLVVALGCGTSDERAPTAAPTPASAAPLDGRRALLPPTAFDRWCYTRACPDGVRTYEVCAETRAACDRRRDRRTRSGEPIGRAVSPCALVAGVDRGPVVGDFPGGPPPTFGAALDAPPLQPWHVAGRCADDDRGDDAR